MKKAKFRQQEESKYLHEGDTYRPGIDLQMQPIDGNGSIPSPPCVEPAYLVVFVCFFNLETTGLGWNADVMQL